MTFTQDSTYYHTYVEFEFLQETPKAYLLCIKGLTIWVPKKLCKEFTGTSAYIYTDILEKNIAAAKNKAGAWGKGFRPKNKNSVIGEKTLNLDKQQLKHLISLCHPDRHNNSKISNEITTILLKKR